ncbi:hypothetical protein C8A03DRAFT_35527 [Achaetomium macrosporum]|uniref:Uncharacterized protein n=1 Tax=Achaetomium macrosporum TaxID=79813 RepID=A0AAN7C8Y9_9PEZI|nr:hypothetical protein C8A03DRAFT_35527 [Achaetomium macrosporum]
MSQPSGDINDRTSIVSSFCGPGTVGSWLCILASVFVTWTLNLDGRRRDSITNDFIAALSMPAIAAGHVFYLLFSAQRSAELGEYASLSQRDLFTNPLPLVARYAAAVEAPLNVCETFSAMALSLFVIAALRHHTRRAICVLIVGLSAFSTESITFAHTSGIAMSESNLARPFLFNFFEAMVLILAFLAVSLAALLVAVVGKMIIAVNSGRASASAQRRGVDQELEAVTDEEMLRQRPDRGVITLSFNLWDALKSWG